MRPPSEKQLDLAFFFDTEIPSPAADQPGALACESLAAEICARMTEAIGASGRSRPEIAERMGQYLDEAVSKAILDAYTAQSRPAHNINLKRAIAFDLATGQHALLKLFAAKCGAKVLFGSETLLTELGRAELLRDELNGHIRRIKQRMEERR